MMRMKENLNRKKITSKKCFFAFESLTSQLLLQENYGGYGRNSSLETLSAMRWPQGVPLPRNATGPRREIKHHTDKMKPVSEHCSKIETLGHSQIFLPISKKAKKKTLPLCIKLLVNMENSSDIDVAIETHQ